MREEVRRRGMKCNFYQIYRELTKGRGISPRAPGTPAVPLGRVPTAPPQSSHWKGTWKYESLAPTQNHGQLHLEKKTVKVNAIKTNPAQTGSGVAGIREGPSFCLQ